MRGVTLGGVMAWAAAIVSGTLIGAASAWAALELGRANFAEDYGSWRMSRVAGSESADAYTRAIVARDGLLALNAREALYFSLSEDEHGRQLEEACVYELSGRDLPARWWSVTLYGDDNYLIRNGDHAASIDSTDVQGGRARVWRARIAPVRGEAMNWLSSRSAGRGVILMLRVYNAQDGWRPNAEELPTLTTVSCMGTAV